MALIARRTDDGVRSGTNPRLAGVRLRASVAVAAGRPVSSIRVRAGASRRVASPCYMALVARTADNRARACADAGHARIGLGAGVAVAAGRAVGSVRVRARARCRIAGPTNVALVARRADEGAGAGADPGLARVRL